MRVYLVLTKQKADNGEMVDVIESRRTSMKAAEADVRHLADLSNKRAWILEEERDGWS